VPAIVSIVYTPASVERKPKDWYARVPLDHALLVEGHGIEGDLKGSRGQRQLNIMRAEAVAELEALGLQTKPGELGEQLIIAGLDPASLVPGARLRLGESAVIEITRPRTGCDRFEHIQGTSKESMDGRLGVMAKVVIGGEIRVSDAVEIGSEL
jgi:MOSC domain-containing protein YiiM